MSWTKTNRDMNNIKKFETDKRFALDNPDLINNLNESLKGITAQELVDMVDYFSGDIPDHPNREEINKLKHCWCYIKFIPKRGRSFERFWGRIINDDKVNFTINDGEHLTNVKVSTISKTYKFVGEWY